MADTESLPAARNVTSTLKNTTGMHLKIRKVKIEVPCDTTILCLGTCPDIKTESPRDIIASVVIAALSHNSQGVEIKPSLLRDDWMKRMCCVCVCNIYCSILKKQILPFVTTWANLKDTVFKKSALPVFLCGL